MYVFVFVKGAMFRVTGERKANKHSQQGELVRQMVRAQLSCLRRSLTFGVLERCGGRAGEGRGGGGIGCGGEIKEKSMWL